MKILPTLTLLSTLVLSAALARELPANSAASASDAARPESTRSGAHQDDYAELRRKAEAQYENGSYTRARKLYEAAQSIELEEADMRWVEFRLADCAWRAASKTNVADTTVLDQARAALEKLAQDPEHVEDRELVWAESNASLGSFFWGRRGSADWWNGWQRYQKALEYWGASSDLEVARRRYLDIVFEVGLPSWDDSPWNRGNYASNIPIEILRNAVKIAVDVQDVARANYLIGKHYSRRGQDLSTKGRTERAFQAVIELGKTVEWYDDSLYFLANYLQSQGRARRVENGTWQWQPEYVDAVALYRRILREFSKGETHWYDQARSSIAQITEPSVHVSVDHFFLPGAQAAYDLGWRNVDEVELKLYPTSLVNDVAIEETHGHDYLQSIALEGLEVAASWTHATGDTGEHRPGNARLDLAAEVAPGAYVLEARAGQKRARALVLISDVAVTAKATSEDVLVWMTDVLTGEPIAEADVRIWQWYHDSSWRLREQRGTTAADGTVRFAMGSTDRYTQMFVAGQSGQRQAFAQSGANPSLTPSEEWRLYAITDRSTYRPGHEVKWRVIARRFDGQSYSTPGLEKLRWFVTDPRGSDWNKGTFELDEFGCVSGELLTKAEDTLGEYSIRFLDEKNHHVGAAKLFRLEEYKLPEFEVSVSVPDGEDGKPKRYVHGDVIEAEIRADYYFGGSVSDASVEVFVYQKPYWHSFPDDREFAWLHEQEQGRAWWGGNGSQITHQVLTTDAEGKATITFETPFASGPNSGDFEYTIEARVTDASRREIQGTGSVRVTHSEYFVRVKPEHAIHRPGTKIEIGVEALDANGNPVAAEGKLVVERTHWLERWRDPAGKTFEGSRVPRPLPQGWEQTFRGYERDLIAEVTLSTNDAGRATWNFTPKRHGSFEVRWTSIDARDTDVKAQTSVIVADESTREIGYFSGGVEILIDEDTLTVGEDAVFLLATPASGRWVLVTVEGALLQHHEVVKMDGTVKLMRVGMTDAHVPNIWLTATSFADGVGYRDSVQVVVPPTKQFLDVEVTHSADTVEPGAEGEVSIFVRDHSGEPVSAQVSIGVVDASLAYIQGDYAADPRRFFYGQRRPLRVGTFGSHDQRRYAQRDEKKEGGDYRGQGDSAPGRAGGLFKDDLDGSRAKASRSRESSQMASAPAVAMEMEALGYAGDDGRADNFAAAQAVGGQAQGAPTVRVRSDFRETALWSPAVVTDDTGRAKLTLTYPDSTTRWQTTVRAVDRGTRVGQDDAKTRTRQPLIARLQAPRFFVVGDEATVSGNLNNNTDSEMRVQASLEIEGLELVGAIFEGKLVANLPDEFVISAGGQTRVDWRLRAVEPGQAKLVLRAIGPETGDAIERSYPVHAHGIDALVATSGRFDDGSITFSVDLPAQRAAGSTTLDIQVTPSLAVTMLDALPYLVDYPYGCTEQTLSRFLPSTIVAKTLRDFGLSPEDAMTRVFGGIEREFVDKTQPKGRQALDRLDQMTEQGLERLYSFQHSDGSWSWWKHGDGDHFMTAYVLWGLSLARDSGLEVRSGTLEQAARYLARELVEREWDVDLQAWMLHALATFGRDSGDSNSRRWMDTAFKNLWESRDRLNTYGRALFTLSAQALGRENEARILADNLIDGAVIDDSQDTSIVQRGAQSSQGYVLKTAHWGSDGIGQRWSSGAVEATAFALRALVAVDPGHELVEPAANWLVQNRRGAQWSNTRDTAIVVLALNDYLRASKQLGSGVSYEVKVNGHAIASVELAADELLRGPGSFSVDPDWIRGGKNEIVIEKTSGDGPLFFAAHARFFSQEEPIPARGNQIFVRRQYYKMVGRPTLLAGYLHDRVPLEDGDSVASGERVQVVLTMEAKNDLEYMLFEDLKPAGFEAVQVRSGESMSIRELKLGELEQRLAENRGPDTSGGRRGAAYTNRSHRVHQELRDRKVALFVDRMEDGLWELTYELRAESPGTFHALPVLGHAMYVPEIRCNGEELRVEVLD